MPRVITVRKTLTIQMRKYSPARPVNSTRAAPAGVPVASIVLPPRCARPSYDSGIQRIILRRGELRVFQHQPLHAALAEVHLHARIRPAPLRVHDDARSEVGMHD